MHMEIIARIYNDFPEKFGLPRQSGLIENIPGKIIFTPKYRFPEAIRGLKDFSHIWLIWQFSKNICHEWSPTVRPPRLGGNKRLGVFATRSPFRPNFIGISCVQLEKIIIQPSLGPVLYVRGADLASETPILDIKPYISTDCHHEATFGFTKSLPNAPLEVNIPQAFHAHFTNEQLDILKHILALDPRPHYQNQPSRQYGMRYAGFQVRFVVVNNVLTVTEINPENLDQNGCSSLNEN